MANQELEFFDEVVKAMATSRLDEMRMKVIRNRRRLDYEFGVWLKQTDFSDPENVLILQRVRLFEIKINQWREKGRENDLLREMAKDKIFCSLQEMYGV